MNTYLRPLVLTLVLAGCGEVTDDPLSDTGSPGDTPGSERYTQDDYFECDGQLAAGPARFQRLDAQQYYATVMDKEVLEVPFLPGPGDAYSTYASDETVDTTTLREFMRHADAATRTWSVSNNNGWPRIKINGGVGATEGLECMQVRWNGVIDPDEACVGHFVGALLEHGVLMRPPTEAEVDRLTDFALAQLARAATDPEFADLDDEQRREAVIGSIVSAAWVSRAGVFREELGQGEVLADGRRSLSDREFAQAMSLSIGHHVTGVSQPGYKTVEDEDNRYYQDLHVRVGDSTTLSAEGREVVEPSAPDAELEVSSEEVIAWFVDKHVAGSGPAVCYPDDDLSTFTPVQTGCDESRLAWSRIPGQPCYPDEYWMADKVRLFFQEWLDYGDADSVFKVSPEATSIFADHTLLRDYYPDVNESYYYRSFAASQHSSRYGSARLADHLDNLIARILVDDTDVLRELLTTRRYFVKDTSYYNHSAGVYRDAPEMNAVYNHIMAEQGTIHGLEERWFTFPEEERAGVLTHPAWLAAHGDNLENGSSLVHRGMWIREHLLCEDVPSVPITVDTSLPESTAELSARHRFEISTENEQQCWACHQLMNPLGYPLEQYNHAGYVRYDDHGAPPRTDSVLTVMPEGSGLEGLEVANAPEMMEAFADSNHVKRCFIRQTFRFFAGRDETINDACTLADMEDAYDTSGGSFKEMLVTLYASDSFQLRVDEEGSDVGE